jgi:hypothetical protein
MIINKKEDTLMKFGDIKIYESKDGDKDVVFVVRNKMLLLAATLNGGTELKFGICYHRYPRDFRLANNIKVNQFGFGRECAYDSLMKISRWYTVDELVKLVKNVARSLGQKEPDDSAWICYRYGVICIADENNHWTLKIGPKLSIKQCEGGSKAKWPSDRIPVSKCNEPLMPLEYVIKTLQANYGAIYDPFAWDKENEITFKTVAD